MSSKAAGATSCAHCDADPLHDPAVSKWADGPGGAGETVQTEISSGFCLSPRPMVRGRPALPTFLPKKPPAEPLSGACSLVAVVVPDDEAKPGVPRSPGFATVTAPERAHATRYEVNSIPVGRVRFEPSQLRVWPKPRCCSTGRLARGKDHRSSLACGSGEARRMRLGGSETKPIPSRRRRRELGPSAIARRGPQAGQSIPRYLRERRAARAESVRARLP
jgi:hypothetical protein